MECCFILEKTRFFILMKFLFNVAGFRWSRTCSFKTTACKKKAKKMCYFIKKKIATKKIKPRYLKKGPFLPPNSTYIDGPTVKKTLRHKKIKLIYLQILLKKYFSRKLLSLQSRKTHLYIRTIIFIVKMVLPQINIVKKTLKQFFKKSQ